MMERLLAELVEAGAARTAPPPFNPVDLLATRETAQSRIFGWMLDPRGTHGMGTRFLDGFLAMLDVSCSQPGRFRPQLEAAVAGGGQAGRVDILLTHPEWAIAVENKPTANFQPRQLERYAAAIRKLRRSSLVVVLLGSGWSDEDVVDIRSKADTRCLMLGGEVQAWVRQCATLAGEGPVGAFIAAFARFLRAKFGDGMDDDMQNDVDIMLRSPESVMATLRILNAQDGFAAGMSRRFEAIVAARCAAHGLALRPVHDEYPVFSPHKDGMLRIDIGHPDYDFGLSPEQPMFEAVCLGVCMRKAVPFGNRTYGALRATLSDRLGPSEGPGEWWPWWVHLSELDPSGARTADATACWAWAMDESDDGLAAVLVERARQTRDALEATAAPSEEA
jgi:hypothetical protein